MSDEGPRYPLPDSSVITPKNTEFLGRFGDTDLYRLLDGFGEDIPVARVSPDGDFGYAGAAYYVGRLNEDDPDDFLRRIISPEAREFLKAYVQLMQ